VPVIQAPLDQRGRQARKAADGQVDRAVGQRLAQAGRVHHPQRQAHMGRARAHRVHDARPQHVGADVGVRDTELALRRGGVEALRGQNLVAHALKDVSQRRGQRGGARRRAQAAPGAHEQLVTQLLAQTAQGRTQGGLADVELARRARGAAPTQQRVQHRQQVEIDALEVHVNGSGATRSDSNS
jgi:hypothetical protein